MNELRRDENARFIQSGSDQWVTGTLVALQGFINVPDDEILLFGFVGNGEYLLVERAEVDGREIDVKNIQYDGSSVEYIYL